MTTPLDLAERWRREADAYERDGAPSGRGIPITDLAEKWRDEGAVLRRYGQDRLADLCERHADDMEAAFESHAIQELTIAQAADESGYSEDRLRELVREGRIPDNRPPGSQGEMRIRRCDLPRKPGAQRQTLSVVEDMASRILAARR